jgi:hypothetical protein
MGRAGRWMRRLPRTWRSAHRRRQSGRAAARHDPDAARRRGRNDRGLRRLSRTARRAPLAVQSCPRPPLRRAVGRRRGASPFDRREAGFGAVLFRPEARDVPTGGVAFSQSGCARGHDVRDLSRRPSGSAECSRSRRETAAPLRACHADIVASIANTPRHSAGSQSKCLGCHAGDRAGSTGARRGPHHMAPPVAGAEAFQRAHRAMPARKSGVGRFCKQGGRSGGRPRADLSRPAVDAVARGRLQGRGNLIPVSRTTRPRMVLALGFDPAVPSVRAPEDARPRRAYGRNPAYARRGPGLGRSGPWSSGPRQTRRTPPSLDGARCGSAWGFGIAPRPVRACCSSRRLTDRRMRAEMFGTRASSGKTRRRRGRAPPPWAQPDDRARANVSASPHRPKATSRRSWNGSAPSTSTRAGGAENRRRYAGSAPASSGRPSAGASLRGGGKSGSAPLDERLRKLFGQHARKVVSVHEPKR